MELELSTRYPRDLAIALGTNISPTFVLRIEIDDEASLHGRPGPPLGRHLWHRIPGRHVWSAMIYSTINKSRNRIGACFQKVGMNLFRGSRSVVTCISRMTRLCGVHWINPPVQCPHATPFDSGT